MLTLRSVATPRICAFTQLPPSYARRSRYRRRISTARKPKPRSRKRPPIPQNTAVKTEGSPLPSQRTQPANDKPDHQKQKTHRSENESEDSVYCPSHLFAHFPHLHAVICDKSHYTPKPSKTKAIPVIRYLYTIRYGKQKIQGFFCKI